MPTPAGLLFSKSDEFLIGAAKAWKIIKETKEQIEPLSKAKEGLELAHRASQGELGAYSDGVEKIRVYVANQKDQLADLARKDEDYWMERSGANVLDRAAMADARTSVDEWVTNFSQLRTLIQQFLPAVQAARSVFNNPAVVAARSAFEESSLPALDGLALSQVVSDLNNSLRSLDVIIQRLQNCRNRLG
jgi:hypothetical protein